MLTLSGLQELRIREALHLHLRPNPISHSFPRHSSSFSPSNPRKNRSCVYRRLCIRSLGGSAIQPYDFKTQRNELLKKSVKLKIAIVGFGSFVLFLAKTLIRQGHTVLAYSQSKYTVNSSMLVALGVSFYSDPHDLCEEQPEVVLLCTSIISLESILKSLPLQRLKRSTLFVDVLSVKEMPKKLFLQILPPEFDILCTHPIFGPESGRSGWAGLPLVYEKVRIGNEDSRINRCNAFLKIFSQEGCRMVEMSCAEHDRYSAGTQLITHIIGRTLGKIDDLDWTPMNTKGYETLLNLRDNTCADNFELLYGLFIYNKNALEQLQRLDMAFQSVKKQLYGHLHNELRKQLFENPETNEDTVDDLPVLPPN
ncbi:arogenate dehydrogenase 2, chloroplastic-like [Macadamia integrifolia]|uniref:arogenate dehydrogenase 2, chloroplastic-like n=1 Tax=Macadamia integrifolia TaxID=60698 RepID=UPI001C4FBCF5|nr:arogenate dehydrogenase 2, chloroplastic-like [Macadamia integrifolia]